MRNFALRIPESLLSSAKELASTEKTSLNQFFAIAIAEKVSSMKTARFFEERAVRADPEAALAILSKAGRVAPAPEDRISTVLRTRLRDASAKQRALLRLPYARRRRSRGDRGSLQGLTRPAWLAAAKGGILLGIMKQPSRVDRRQTCSRDASPKAAMRLLPP